MGLGIEGEVKEWEIGNGGGDFLWLKMGRDGDEDDRIEFISAAVSSPEM